MNIPSHEPDPDSMIAGLHQIRESIVESFGGDLHALTDDARRRQEQSGRPIWRGNKLSKPLPLSKNVTPLPINNTLPSPGDR